MKPLNLFLCVASILFGLNGIGWAQKKEVVALQPLGKFEPQLLQQITEGITARYRVEVVTLGKKPMPQEAFYAPRNRYRAEKILTFLDHVPERSFSKIIGLTTDDISTTKGPYPDWGVMGFGLLQQRPCVVSTFRLGGKKVSNRLFLERLVKIVNHELGHTFGLDHCPQVGCYMEDVKGKVKTVDNWNGELCAGCRKNPLLKGIVK
ncbi:MAG: Zn-dependent protease [Blastocatellia bacterium]|nr:Zn-dependent protease [Blastocatellia bacterium]